MVSNNPTIKQIAGRALVRAMRNHDLRGTDIDLEEATCLQTCGGKIAKLDEPSLDNCYKHTIFYSGFLFKILTDKPSRSYIAFINFPSSLEE